MNKIYKIMLPVVMILLIASLVGNLYLMSNREKITQVRVTSSQEEYDEKYKDFNSQTKTVKMAMFEAALNAGTSPTEVKYLLLKLGNDMTDAEKDDAIAKYINHIQYFASTYTNLATMYGSIIQSLSDKVDFSTRDAAFQVSDKVLRNLLLEIWDSDMILYMESATAQPSVLVDYESLTESYADFMTSTTKDYITLKNSIINGTITNEDGSISYDNLEKFMVDTYSFITAHPNFAIIDDVKYMYVVAAKMYLNVYLVNFEDVKFSSEDLTRIESFVARHDTAPAAKIGQLILDDIEANGALTEDVFNQVVSNFAALAN